MMQVACVLLDLPPCCGLLTTKAVLLLPTDGVEGPEVATLGRVRLEGVSLNGYCWCIDTRPLPASDTSGPDDVL